MIPTKKVEDIISKYENLEKELSSGNLESKLFAKKSKEYSNLGNVISFAKKYLNFDKEKSDLDQIIKDKKNDAEIIEMAKRDLDELKDKKKEYENRLKIFLLPKDEDDDKNAIVEIRAGTGGLEASLFCADLFKMYEKVCSKKKWKLEIINISKSEAGGFKEVIFSVSGNDIYSYLKYESGVHRVQRIPKTETQGRVHTSASTVAVLPEAEEVDIQIKESDLRVDVFRAGGPGGQSVNTTDSAVRITHIPSGVVVSQQDEKSQHKNKAKALKILRSRVYEAEKNKKDKERSADRKNQIGSGDRSERIRTYNFPQGRVTDHRINLTLHKLDEFLSGEIHEEMNQELRLKEQDIKLKTYLMEILEIINKSSELHKKKNIQSHKLDSELLLSKVLKKTREELIINQNQKVDREKIYNFNKLVKRRSLREPIAYILNKKEFWSKEFKVNKHVLVPRPETELMVELIIKTLRNNKKKMNMLDIGTGTGCILISILSELELCTGVGIDISKQAIMLAKKNALKHKLNKRVKFYTRSVDDSFSQNYDLIVSNPPYIKKNEIINLQDDIKKYEPKLA